MTLRETYEKIRDHMLRQWRKSVDSRGACLYRGPEGMKCAIGVLIDDAFYDPCIEGVALSEMGEVESERVNVLLRALYASDVDIDTPGMLRLLDKAQNIHDALDPCMWAEALARLEEIVRSYEGPLR